MHADDAMAILAAFNSPDVEIVGFTTLFGNVRTPQATANAIVLRELAEREDVSYLSRRPTHPKTGCQMSAFRKCCS